MAANVQPYDFTLILDGIEDLSEELANALYEAGCDDATAAVIHGVPLIDFTREAESFPKAVISALRDVAKVQKQFPSVRVVRVEIPDQEFLQLINATLALPRIPSSFEKTVGNWLRELLGNKVTEDSPTPA